jgi:hypothetical protein
MESHGQRRNRLFGLVFVAALLMGALLPLGTQPAVAQDETPFVYVAGATAEGFVQIGGAWFSEVPPYIFVSRAPGDVVIGVHYILSAEVWLYEGTWQFVTSTPYVDCSPYEGGFIYYIAGYDPGRNLYSNWIPVDICGEIG